MEFILYVWIATSQYSQHWKDSGTFSSRVLCEQAAKELEISVYRCIQSRGK